VPLFAALLDSLLGRMQGRFRTEEVPLGSDLLIVLEDVPQSHVRRRSAPSLGRAIRPR